jgi:mono/diheme cytochrome c family protein
MRSPFFVILCALSALPAPAPAAEEARAAEGPDFARDVLPLFRARCFRCHGPDKQESGYRLDSRAIGLRGGDSGEPPITKGESNRSPLIAYVEGNGDLAMPPEGEKLTAKEVDTLRRWIDAGAVWPDEHAGEDGSRNLSHWSFQKIVRPPVPETAADAFSGNPIDAFVLAGLRENDLQPSPEAERRTLIRRVYFDVVGLPPAPEEIDEFVRDTDPAAYERLVDRLLASPHFGERWARHWLDVVRFAESHGFEMNQPRPNAWPYRDYVIRSFNEDKPYDRFIVEQLAGDALGVDEATGFLVGGPWDQVKSPDPVLTAQQRADELHDMVSTTGSAFLGLTVGCARCHGHKFDPISQADYHALKAALAGVTHGERPIRPADSAERERQLAELRQDLHAAESRLAEFRLRPPVAPGENVDYFTPVIARFVRFSVSQTDAGGQPCLDELEVFSAGPNGRNVALARAGAKVKVSSTLPGYAIHQPTHLNDGRYGNDWSWISNEPGKGLVELQLAEPVEIERVVWSRDRSPEPQYADRLATGYEIAVSIDGVGWQTVASSADRLDFGQKVEPGVVDSTKRLSADELAEAGRVQERRKEIEARIAAMNTGQQAYAGVFTAPPKTFRLHRGDPMQPKEEVPPGGLSRFGGPQLPADLPEQERRLGLARWIASPENELTARVIVNRLWQHHFGQGIVNTPSDFGVNGGKPTHPQLLDWLASELIEPTPPGVTPWSLKHVHRLILLSSTYRQSDRAGAAGLERDAQCRLLWRYPPRRLEAEAIRDSILAVCGTLDRAMGGPGFDLFEPNGNYVKVYTPKREFGADTFRRMVYQAKPRMQLDDTFGAFDCPDAGQIAPKRMASTTPLQAFNLLNSPFLLQQADYLAARLRADAGDDPERQIQRAFRLAFGRDPQADETAAAVVLIRQHGLSVFCRALFSANEFVTVY